MLTDSQVNFFRDNGYLIHDKRVLSPDRVEELKLRLGKVMAGEAEGKAELLRNLTGDTLEADKVVVQIVNIWEADSLFRDLIYDPDITEMISQLLDCDTVRLWHDQIQYKPPVKGAPTDWHQDHPFWPIIEPADLVSCWIALDDTTLENGCMRVVPGSHKWGAAPGGLQTDEEFNPVYNQGAVPDGAKVTVVPCEIPSGHCMFHHCLNWHGSWWNRSQKPRRAIALHYMPGYTRYEPKAGHEIEHRVTVEAGEVLKGDYFPTVRENGFPIRPAAV